MTKHLHSLLGLFILMASLSDSMSAPTFANAAVVSSVVGSPLRLRSPRETLTETSAILLWDKPADSQKASGFEIYLNGSKFADTDQLCFKLDKLTPATTYVVSLRTLDAYGHRSEPSPALTLTTSPAGPVLDVTQPPYAADSTGRTLATAAIQRTIDDCPPGGTVLIPPGTYTTSGLFLKSDLTLRLDGTLQGSLNLDDYPLVVSRFEKFDRFHASMIHIGSLDGEVVRNVKILGSGVIHANGDKLRAEFSRRYPFPYNRRNSNFTTLRCEGVYLDGLRIENSCCWSVHPILSDDVTIYGIELVNQGYDVVNGDGINPDACRRVNILKCILRSQDDGISIKSGDRDDSYTGQRACEDVLISDCTFRGGFGISPGIQSYYGIRRVTARNCVFRQTSTIFHPICRRESYAARTLGSAGGVIEDITLSDIQFFNDTYTDNMWMRGPIDFNMFYTAGPLDNPDYDADGPLDDQTPLMRNITLENITIVDRSDRYGITMIGRHESKISNVLFRNVQCLSKLGMQLINVANITFENLSNVAETGQPSLYRNCDEVRISPNLVRNPGFELGNVEWSFNNTRVIDAFATHTADHAFIRDGVRALKLFTPTSRATQDIPLRDVAATRLVLRAAGRVLTEGVTGRIVVRALDTEGRLLDGFEQNIVFTETRPLAKESTFAVPAGAAALRLEARTDGNAFWLEHVDLFSAPRITAQAFNDDAACFSYSPGFRRREGQRQSYHGDVHEAVGTGEKITVTFTGTQARLYGEKAADAGRIEVSIDGAPPQVIDLHADTTLPAQLWLDTGILPQGDHVITVLTSARPGSVAAPQTAFDYAYVLSET